MTTLKTTNTPVLSTHNEHDYDRLKRDIAERGCLVPVEVCDETGEVIDGIARERACRELGIKAPLVRRQLDGKTARAEHRLTLNLVRRQLDTIEWAEAFEKLLELRGVTRKAGRKSANEETVAAIAKECGIQPRTARNRLQAARELRAHPDLLAKVKTGQTSIRTARIKAQVRERKLAPAPELPKGQFSTIVIDPPWSFDKGGSGAAWSAEAHYPTMPLEDICDLGKKLPAADNAHLYLWICNANLSQGFQLLEEWGWEYRTMLTWCKDKLGVGAYFRNNTEHVLFATRGKLALQAHNLPTWFAAPRGRHSAKPDEFYELVGKASPGPCLDVFARREREGWTTWGNEV